MCYTYVTVFIRNPANLAHILGWSTKFRGREILRNIYFVFREIIFFISQNFAKFCIAKYYDISQNLHNETILQNNLCEISQNFEKFCKRKYNQISRNFAKLKSLSSLFRISQNKKNPISRPP
jgi:hypothetical protein